MRGEKNLLLTGKTHVPMTTVFRRLQASQMSPIIHMEKTMFCHQRGRCPHQARLTASLLGWVCGGERQCTSRPPLAHGAPRSPGEGALHRGRLASGHHTQFLPPLERWFSRCRESNPGTMQPVSTMTTPSSVISVPLRPRPQAWTDTPSLSGCACCPTRGLLQKHSGSH